MKIKNLFFILASILSSESVYCTYADQEKYASLFESLEQTAHPWAKKFVETYKAINQQQKTDIRWLQTQITQSSDGKDEKSVANEVSELLHQESIFAETFLNALELDEKKASDHWTLFTGLNKMMGDTGIYETAAQLLNQKSELVFNLGGTYFNSDIPVIKTIGLQTILHLQNIQPGEPGAWNDIIPHLGVYCPNKLDGAFAQYGQAASALNFTSTGMDDVVTYWRPSASYEFGGNDPDHHIWDCSSFVAYISDCPWRFSTLHQAEGWRKQQGTLASQELGVSEKDWNLFKQVFEALHPDAERQVMDVLVYRGHQGGGHTGFYLGEDLEVEGNILLGEMNRFDDKTYDGIGIRSVSLASYRETGNLYFFRHRDARM